MRRCPGHCCRIPFCKQNTDDPKRPYRLVEAPLRMRYRFRYGALYDPRQDSKTLSRGSQSNAQQCMLRRSTRLEDERAKYIGERAFMRTSNLAQHGGIRNSAVYPTTDNFVTG